MVKPPIDPATGRRRPGRPARLDRDRIAEAALAEIDGLSIAAVARRLEVSQGSLYHHVDGLTDLVSLAADRSLGDLDSLDPSTPGAAAVTDLVTALVTRLRAHPGLDDALLTLTSPPPRLVELIDEVVERLVDDGADRQAAIDAVGIVAQIAHTLERHRRMIDGDPQAADDQLRRRVRLVLSGAGVE